MDPSSFPHLVFPNLNNPSDCYIVGNFSSPHSFIFDTGDVLEAVSDDMTKMYSLVKESIEVESSRGFYISSVSFKLTDAIWKRLYDMSLVCDVIIVPFPMLQALKDSKEYPNHLTVSEIKGIVDSCFTVFITDRISKTCSSSIFCQ